MINKPITRASKVEREEGSPNGWIRKSSLQTTPTATWANQVWYSDRRMAEGPFPIAGWPKRACVHDANGESSANAKRSYGAVLREITGSVLPESSRHPIVKIEDRGTFGLITDDR
jgi:hypothetical protein